MTDAQNPADELSPAEQRLSEHLELLRISGPSAAPDLILRIVRRVRWQRAVRDPLHFVGAVAGAIGEGLRLLLGQPAADGATRPEHRGRR